MEGFAGYLARALADPPLGSTGVLHGADCFPRDKRNSQSTARDPVLGACYCRGLWSNGHRQPHTPSNGHERRLPPMVAVHLTS